ncbi:MAG TPA: septal ring lytic transglycosylase RlpA family protein [Burkholderiales bacterium]|nr:septal ring lytic transglycosylase RlpA family protein [Burkholderiales bacterium]
MSALLGALAACGTTVKREAPIPPTMEKDQSGRYYLDDGPGPNPPANIEAIPDAVPKLEPLHRGASRPYSVMGQHFLPMTALARYKARGTATWYGRRYHGKPTSSGEPYDMYAMTAAHPTLPIPSYARVTNLTSGRSVIVRINDRGPFIGDRLIDLSYTAAYKLGILKDGSALVEVETILPGDPPPTVAKGGTAEPKSLPQPPVPATHAVAAIAAPAAVPIPASQPASASVTSAPHHASAEPTTPPAPAAAASAPAPNSEASAVSGIYVQFGAFRSRDNAENLLARLRQQAEWLAARLHVLPREGLYRVHAGPYSNQDEARHIANRIGDMLLGARPVLLRW